MKRMSGKTSIFWVEDPTYDPLLPSVALLTSARDISCSIATGYKLNPVKSDTNNKMTICDTAEVETPIRYNYEGDLTFFREGDMADNTSAFARAFEFFSTGRKAGYLVRRSGLDRSVPLATGQKVDSFKFVNDTYQDADDAELVMFQIKFLQQGNMQLDKALVA